MVERSYFSKQTFAFLRQLKQNNTKEWFQEHKRDYEQSVRLPLVEFIQDLAPPLQKISSFMVADPRLIGGSMFRIHRDVRFSRDKSPYKTNAGAHFRHEAGKDAHAPGYYLHIEPGNVFAGAGIWRPDTGTLTKIRERIVAEPEAWQKSLTGRSMKTVRRLEADKLKKAPRGFDPDHPLIEDLKQKSYAVSQSFSDTEACQADFLSRYVHFCRSCIPHMQFLTRALNLPF